MKKQHKKPRNPRNNKNQKHDFWIRYYSDGSIWYKGQYVNGFKHGLWLVYDWDNDNLIYKGHYIKYK